MVWSRDYPATRSLFIERTIGVLFSEDDPNERVNVCLDRLVKLGANAPTILPHVIRIRRFRTFYSSNFGWRGLLMNILHGRSQIEILQKRLQELSRLRMSLVARNS